MLGMMLGDQERCETQSNGTARELALKREQTCFAAFGTAFAGVGAGPRRVESEGHDDQQGRQQYRTALGGRVLGA
jgi:hypothetical protein